MKPKGLGKGLGAIFEIEEHNVAGIEIKTASSEIALSDIDANPSQPRTVFDETALAELAESINRLGVIQPITVRRAGGRYQIISGERRYRAALLAGMKTIAAYVRAAGDTELLEMALVENVQREELGAMEIALTMRRLTSELGLTQEQLSKSVGQRRSTVANYLRLLTLAPAVQRAVGEDKITLGHAKVLAGVDDTAMQVKILEKIVKNSLSVRATEELIVKERTPMAAPKKSNKNTQISQYGELLNNIFGAKHVKIDASERGAGRVILKFSSQGELDTIIKKISGK